MADDIRRLVMDCQLPQDRNIVQATRQSRLLNDYINFGIEKTVSSPHYSSGRIPTTSNEAAPEAIEEASQHQLSDFNVASTSSLSSVGSSGSSLQSLDCEDLRKRQALSQARVLQLQAELVRMKRGSTHESYPILPPPYNYGRDLQSYTSPSFNHRQDVFPKQCSDPYLNMEILPPGQLGFIDTRAINNPHHLEQRLTSSKPNLQMPANVSDPHQNTVVNVQSCGNYLTGSTPDLNHHRTLLSNPLLEQRLSKILSSKSQTSINPVNLVNFQTAPISESVCPLRLDAMSSSPYQHAVPLPQGDSGIVLALQEQSQNLPHRAPPSYSQSTANHLPEGPTCLATNMDNRDRTYNSALLLSPSSQIAADIIPAQSTIIRHTQTFITASSTPVSSNAAATCSVSLTISAPPTYSEHMASVRRAAVGRYVNANDDRFTETSTQHLAHLNICGQRESADNDVFVNDPFMSPELLARFPHASSRGAVLQSPIHSLTYFDTPLNQTSEPAGCPSRPMSHPHYNQTPIFPASTTTTVCTTNLHDASFTEPEMSSSTSADQRGDLSQPIYENLPFYRNSALASQLQATGNESLKHGEPTSTCTVASTSQHGGSSASSDVSTERSISPVDATIQLQLLFQFNPCSGNLTIDLKDFCNLFSESADPHSQMLLSVTVLSQTINCGRVTSGQSVFSQDQSTFEPIVLYITDSISQWLEIALFSPPDESPVQKCLGVAQFKISDIASEDKELRWINLISREENGSLPTTNLNK